MELHKAFLVNDKGESIIYKYYPLRDFFAETPPRSNETIPPKDVQSEIDVFHELATKSGKAFLNIADNNMYWYVFRNWQLKKQRQFIYNIRNVYKTREENSCVIFPRKKGNAITPNNGGPWDYLALARIISPHFDKVYITGHPSMSSDLKSEGNIEVCLSTDNKVVIEKCCNARLIITQHSGAVHIGAYTQTAVLILFNGQPPIKGLADTLRFRQHLNPIKLNFSFTPNEVEKFVELYTLNYA